MFLSFIVRLVDFCRRHALAVTVIALLTSLGLGWYVATNIKINTDTDQLLSNDMPWRQREAALAKAFPQRDDLLVVVVNGKTSEQTEYVAATLTEKIQARPDLFKNISRPEAIPFFRKHGFLYLGLDELAATLDGLIQAQPILAAIANDPSLRGLCTMFNTLLLGVNHGELAADKLETPLEQIAQALEAAQQGSASIFAWRSLIKDHPPNKHELSKFILSKPVLDYGALSPGEAASSAIRQMVNDLKLTQEQNVQVRLTGSIALNDEEFASVADGTGGATILSLVLVMIILFLALRSLRLILPILLTLISGLIATTAFATAVVGSLNLISVAFAVMFVGIAVDFGIQFGVRYRDQRHEQPDNIKALTATAQNIAMPLSLAAGSTALGFFTFIPTDYRGVAELGVIAGAGMLIALALNITLLPALLTLLKPAAEPEAMGFRWAAPIDNWLIENRKKVLGGTIVVAVASLLIATQLRFDFDPLNLKDPTTESVSTMFDLVSDSETTPYDIEILTPDQASAAELAKRLEQIPEVDHVLSLASFVPEQQEQKLQQIGDANMLLAPTLNPAAPLATPNDQETANALRKTADNLQQVLPNSAAAKRLSQLLVGISDHPDHTLLERLSQVLLTGITTQLQTVRDGLTAEPVSTATITNDLRRDWITSDGRAKLEVYPKGNPRDHKVLEKFTKAVSAMAPEAIGTPISIQESAKTVTEAFIQAGIYALIAISLLIWLMLRSVGDVLRLLAPILLSGILTLATMVLIGLPLNFANIIALPLLLSLGVSYAIYFVTYWRAGLKQPLQSSMARAVLFSAATTMVTFGTLSLSKHPGTKGMGELLTISLLYCIICTFGLLPALLGKPK